MRLTARAAGMTEDEDDEVLEAGFSEEADGGGTAVLFQRPLFADDPWQGDPDDPDVFNNVYCVTTGTGETHFGGVQLVEFAGQSMRFTLTPEAAQTLRLEEAVDVNLQVPDGDLQDFKEGLHRVLTWGIPRELPEIRGM